MACTDASDIGTGANMKSADEMRATLLQNIRQLYDEPQMAVYTLGELEAVLCTLHRLYADSTCRLDDHARISGREYQVKPNDFLQYLHLRKKHRPFELAEEAADVVKRWQMFDNEFGIVFPAIRK